MESRLERAPLRVRRPDAVAALAVVPVVRIDRSAVRTRRGRLFRTGRRLSCRTGRPAGAGERAGEAVRSSVRDALALSCATEASDGGAPVRAAGLLRWWLPGGGGAVEVWVCPVGVVICRLWRGPGWGRACQPGAWRVWLHWGAQALPVGLRCLAASVRGGARGRTIRTHDAPTHDVDAMVVGRGTEQR